MPVSSPKQTQPALGKRERLHRGKLYHISKGHPVADFYQWMPEDEIDALAASIRESGQEKPIRRLPDGRIIDGRNRELACLVAGVEPRYEQCDLTTTAEIIAHIRVANEFRRHSSTSQRAMTAARLANLERGSNQYAPKVDGAQAPSISQGEVAKQFHISRDLVKRGLAVLRTGVPELATAVDEGRLDVTTAARVATIPEAAQRVVVSDPDPKTEALRAFFKYPRHEPEEEPPAPVAADDPPIRVTPETPTVGSCRNEEGVNLLGIPEPLADGRVWEGWYVDTDWNVRTAYLIPSPYGGWHYIVLDCCADECFVSKYPTQPHLAMLALTDPTMLDFDIYAAEWEPSSLYEPSEINPHLLDPESAPDLPDELKRLVAQQQRAVEAMRAAA